MKSFVTELFFFPSMLCYSCQHWFKRNRILLAGMNANVTGEEFPFFLSSTPLII